MIRKNDEYIVDIIDNGYQGEGIAKIDGMTIFIDNVLKGEKVKIKILKVLKSQCFAKALEIIEKSENRNKSDCSSYGKCGGCNLRHMSYQETLNLKKSIVETDLKKAGIDGVEVKECIGLENPYNYRNKLQYPVGASKEGPVMGVFAKRSHRIIPNENCHIQNKLTQAIAKDVFQFIIENNIPAYNEENGTGEIRHIYLRIGVKTNEVMLVLVTNKRKITKEKEFVTFITNKYQEIKTVVKNINTKSTNVILGQENEILFGNGYIKDELLGVTFKISPMSFYQVNPTQTERLYTAAIEGAKLTGEETIFDLYCGIGTIGICALKHAKYLYGIETVPQAIEDAKENAKINHIENAEFIVGNVEDELPKLIQEKNVKPDVVFIDPPRKGCDNVAIETLLKIKAKKIVYISCNPATLARDLAKLKEKYEIEEVQPVDMFPFSNHCEIVSVLKLK
ncbi:MAG: 23S rRNA (uracil(1939)-C(5))-methyltransferase RlmD [Clostridia bacterium]|nr:23S rRNA (uracil(1939)-C(5))-methyltransferase RlmD [Clostridia bacterium]